MASEFSHAVVAMALGKAYASRPMPVRFWSLSVLCSVLPDIDVLGIFGSIQYGDLLSHRGLTHSLGFALVLSLVVVRLGFAEVARLSRDWSMLVMYFFLVTASHGFLDAMTGGGSGVAFFAPFDNTRYFLPWRPVMVSPMDLNRFFEHGIPILISEVKWIWVPSGILLAGVLVLRDGHRRSRLPLVVIAGVAFLSLYVEGLLDHAWIDLCGATGEGNCRFIDSPKIPLAFLALVGAYLFAPQTIRVFRGLLVLFTASALAVIGVDLLLRGHQSANDFLPRWLPQLPIVARFPPNRETTVESYGDLAVRSGEPRFLEARQIQYQTDAAGFRNRHGGDDIDTLVMGDSFGVGTSTTQDRTFSSLLESQYGRRVYNLSFPGSPWHEYINFLIESPRLTFRPSARVIWTFYTGDLYDSYGDFWDPAAIPWRDGFKTFVTTYETYRVHSPLRRKVIAWRQRMEGDVTGQRVIERILPTGKPILFNSLYEEEAVLPKSLVERHPHFPKLERTMAEMRARATERGLDLTVVLIPTKGEVYRWIFEQRKRKAEDAKPSGFALAAFEACRRVQIHCLDSKPYLVREAYQRYDTSKELLYSWDDTHLNENGHEEMARFIAREIFAEE
jgi:inner membrane protein